MAGGLAAWWIAGLLIGRAGAARLPEQPDPAVLPAGVATQIAEADAAARRDPRSAAAVGDLGATYHASLRHAEALHAYGVAETLDDRDWRWPYLRGLLYAERGEHAAALDAFAKVTTLVPSNGLAWFHQAEIHLKQGRLDEAQAAYTTARDAPAATVSPAATRPPRRGLPLRAHARLGLARVLYERGDTAGAGTALAALVGEHPSFGTARTLLRQVQAGAAASDAGRAYVPPIDPALDEIVARSLNPDLLLKHAALAARAGDHPWREWLARRALGASPRGLDVLLEMAAMLQAQGRHTEALDYLRQASEVAPDDHHALVQLGKSLSDLGRLEEAEGVLRRAARVRDAAAEYNLGTVLDRMDRWDEARTHYERALAIDPFHASALNNLGVGLDQRGRSNDAIALFRRAIAAAPDEEDAYSNLGTALIGLGRLDAALEVLDRAIALDATAPDPHNNRGIALARLGRLDEARAAFEAAIRLAPGHANARQNLAAIAGRR